MTGPLARRLAAIERHRDALAQWAGVPTAQCPDAVLIAVIGREVGRPPDHCPSNAELAAVIATTAGTASTGAP